MSTREEKLLIAKNRLCMALGDTSTKAYMANLKMWFRKIWTKEQFDFECRKLLSPEQKHLHNEFFIAILNKITYPILSQNSTSNSTSIVESKITTTTYSVPAKSSSTSGGGAGGGGGGGGSSSSSAKKRKRNSRTTSERAVFEPIELYDFLPEDNIELRPPSTPLPQPRFAAQELFLPDTGLILGRLLVAAWENGLANADENVCELVVLAVQTFLKNILTAILKGRKHYRVTNNGNFFYDIGHPLKDPFLRNTVTRQITDDHPFEIDKEISSTNISRRINEDSIFLAACENVHAPATKSRITLIDLYTALQDRNVIPCHSVYANNIERVSQLLN